MMGTKTVFQQALLAEASYADLEDVTTRLQLQIALQRIGSEDSQLDDPNKGFTLTQAEEFVKRWEVINHQPDTDSGFSATLFKSMDTNAIQPYVLAIRGTDGGQDLVVTDGSDIVLDGLAIDQIVDMWNYWKKLITHKGQSFVGSQLVTLEAETVALGLAKAGQFLPGFNMAADAYLSWLYSRDDIIIDNGPLGEIVRTIEQVIPAPGDPNFTGVLDNPLSVTELEAVTGHSLGGHLSVALTRLVPGIKALTINGAGFATGLIPGLGGDAELNMTNLFGILGGASGFDESRILNLFGDKMPEFVTQDSLFGLVQQGGHEPIFIEQPVPYVNVFGHGIGQMVDSLAVYGILSRIDQSITNETIHNLLEAASNEAQSSLENNVRSLGDLIGVNLNITNNNREQLHQHLQVIETELLVDRTTSSPVLKSEYQNLQIIDLSGYTRQEMIDLAQGDIATRYALTHLCPFAVTGSDALYSEHNQNGELDIYNESTREGRLTQSYLEDRADFLQRLIERNTVDSIILPGDGKEYFRDYSSGIVAATAGVVMPFSETASYPTDSDSVRYVFDGDKADLLQGGDNNDHLYGGGGDDVIKGRGGIDYLEGGEGDDTYVAGDGDTILDTDGFGRVVFDEAVLFGGIRTGASGAFESVDGVFRYTLTDNELQVERVSDGALLNIQNFRSGDLGISLDEFEPSPPSDYSLIQGTADSEVLKGEVDISATDNTLVNGYNLPDHIQGGDGRDWIFAWDGSRTYVENQEVINQAPDTDLVEGGSGKDVIQGGPGDDLLYATEVIDAPAVITGQGSLSYGGSSNDEGDFVSGQDGNDELYGSGRTDGLFGGDGDDLIYAGGGDDIIAGDWSAGVSQLSLNPATYDYQWYSIDSTGALQLHLFDYYGGNGRDRIYAGDGNDTVWGGAGDDMIDGGSGQDQLNGDMSGLNSTGDPKIASEHHGDDFIFGGLGDDSLIGNGGSDWLLGGEGNDWLEGDFRAVLSGDLPYHGDDYLDGGAGSDTLIGEGGSDFLFGGTGNDLLYGDLSGLDASYHGNDQLFGGDGNDQLLGFGGDDTLVGGDGNDVLVGGEDVAGDASGNDSIVGGLGDDEIYGGDGIDRIFGGLGADYLDGGSGADTYFMDLGDGELVEGLADAIIDNPGEGNVLIFGAGITKENIRFIFVDNSNSLVVKYSANDYMVVENGALGAISQYTFSVGETVDYSDLIWKDRNDPLNLIAGPDSEILYGSNADDTIDGQQGADVIIAGGGADNIFGGLGDDKLYGGEGDDTLTGGEGGDFLSGGSAGDTLDGGPGADQLWGGAGNDIYIFRPDDDIAAESTIFDLDDLNTIEFRGDITAESVVDIYEDGLDLIIRYTADDQVRVLNGATQAVVDRFNFESGVTAVSLAELTAIVKGGFDQSMIGDSSDDFLKGTLQADFISGHEGNDFILGGAGNDHLIGGVGDDKLNGQAGDDVMVGGVGDDRYYVDAHGDILVEELDAGLDRVYSAIDHSLGSNFENLTLLGNADLRATGNASDNRLNGNVGNNELIGEAGNDWLHGRAGNDYLLGGAGDDVLNGEAGNDQMIGGGGNDRYYVDALGDTLIEEADAGLDQVYSSIDHILGSNFEELVLLSTADLRATGNVADNSLYGNIGNNELDGQAGDDRLYGRTGNDRLLGGDGDDLLNGETGDDQMIGGMGNDRYYVDALGDTLIEEADAGLDRVYSSVEHTLSSNLENLTLLGDADLRATGNASDNRLTGNVGDNELSGKAGNDWIRGRAGNDYLSGGAGQDSLFGEAGDDILRGGAGINDILSGGTGNDTYQYAAGDGNTTINNYDRDANRHDVLQLLTDESPSDLVNIEDLWFSRNGNHLQLTLVGSDDQVTVKNWYSNANYQLDQFEVGTSVLLNNQVDQLVSAMASYNVPSGAGNMIPQDVQDQLQPILAVAWQTA